MEKIKRHGKWKGKLGRKLGKPGSSRRPDLENLSDDNADHIFGNSAKIPAFAVLHDGLPNLGNCRKEHSVRISDPTPTLTNLTAEFNDLSRKMTLLKETIKATRNSSTTKKSGPTNTNSSSQAFQAANITEVATAKLVLHDCIAELISVNHFLDGNEEIAAVYREKLRRAISDKYAKAETVVIQGISISPNPYNPIPREGKPTDDSPIEEHNHFSSQHRTEAEVQTEVEQTVVAEASTDKNVTQPPDSNVFHFGKINESLNIPLYISRRQVSPKSIVETPQQPKRASWRNSRK